MSRSLRNSKSKVSSRQRLLFSLVEALGGKISQTDFQKLLFLYSNEVEAEPTFEFVPYRFGCFSFASYADKRRLIDAGLLENDEATVLSSPADRERVDAARPRQKRPGLLTIGYEGKSLETYLNQLIKAGVTLLCDVRRNPVSRKYGFSKSTLSEACMKVGIDYEHLPDLGIASSERRNVSDREDYAELFATYRKHTLPNNRVALDRIQNWIIQGKHRVALTCFERDPLRCHRHCVAQAIAERDNSRLIALDLP
jgi:hypothetical protein